MNKRTHTADQLKKLIESREAMESLTPEYRDALCEAINELEKNCSNCEHLHERGSRGYFCGIYDFRIPDVDECLCGDHEPSAPF